MVNGHEYVAYQGAKAGIHFTKEGNCFTHISDPAGLAKIADTLAEESSIGDCAKLRWIYSTCLCFGLDLEEQERSGFGYHLNNAQVHFNSRHVEQRGR